MGKSTFFQDALLAIALGLAGWSLAWQFSANADLQLVKYQLENEKNSSKFWKLHGWERHQINVLRVKLGMPLADPPNLDDEKKDSE